MPAYQWHVSHGQHTLLYSRQKVHGHILDTLKPSWQILRKNARSLSLSSTEFWTAFHNGVVSRHSPHARAQLCFLVLNSTRCSSSTLKNIGVRVLYQEVLVSSLLAFQSSQLPLQDRFVILGMDICPDLKLREYIENVTKAASRELGVLNRVSIYVFFIRTRFGRVWSKVLIYYR